MWLFASLVRKTSHELNNHLPHPYRNVLFSHSVRKVDTAQARIKKHALNQALSTSSKKIVFDIRVRKWFYPRVAFSPSLRSGANVPTRIKSLFRTCIENNYFNPPCAKLNFTRARIKKHALNQALYKSYKKIYGSICEREGNFNLVWSLNHFQARRCETLFLLFY